VTIRPSAADWLGLGALVAMWGTAFVVIRLAVETVPPLTVAAGRIAAAAGLLLFAVRAAGLRLPGPGRVWIQLVVLGLIGNCVPFFLIGWGQERVPSALTGILMAVNPLVTLVLAHRFSPGESMTAARSVGFALGFAGIVVLVGPEALLEIGGGASDLARQGAVLAGALCYATNSILARRLPPIHPLVVSASVLAVAAVVILPVATFVDTPWRLAPSAASVAGIVWLGLVPTAVATIVYFRLIASAGATFFSLVNYGVPLVALVAGMLVWGEEPGLGAIAALALILAGIAIAQRSAFAARV
jgi:drug/metabolite transporter (DMT)-like permease